MTKTSVERVRTGKMNLAHYDGILVKKKLAFQAAPYRIVESYYSKNIYQWWKLLEYLNFMRLWQTKVN